jgi:hypothetical protein
VYYVCACIRLNDIRDIISGKAIRDRMLGTALAWLNRKRGAIAMSVVRKLKVATAVPYCHVYSIPLGSVPPTDFKASAYPGLLAWHVVKGSSAPTIISYWQDEPHFQYSRTRFEDALGLAAAQSWGGPAGDLHASKSAFWPSSLKEALIAASAIVGAITVIWNVCVTVSNTLATPKAEVSFAVTKVDLGEGDTTKVSVNARNSTEFVPVRLIAYAKLIGNNTSVRPVPLNPSYEQMVSPDAPETLVAKVIAPRLASRHSEPMDYKLSVSVAVRTWRFGQPKSVQGDELPVRVWPQSFGWTHQLRWIAQQNERFCSASGILYSADSSPAGLRGTVTIVAPESANLKINVPYPFRSNQQLESSPAGLLKSKTIRMDFASPGLEKYREYPFQVTIESARPLPGEVWHSIEEHTDLIFRESGG